HACGGGGGADRDASHWAQAPESAVGRGCGGGCGGRGFGVVLVGGSRRRAGHRVAWPGLLVAERRRDYPDRDLDAEVLVQPRQWAPPPGADPLPDLTDVSCGRQLGAKQWIEQDGRF